MENSVILWKDQESKNLFEQAGTDQLGRIFLYADDGTTFVKTHDYKIVDNLEKEKLFQQSREIEFLILEDDAKTLGYPVDVATRKGIQSNLKKIYRAMRFVKSQSAICSKCCSDSVVFQCQKCNQTFCSTQCAKHH